ncbi:MAG: YciI family protein [Pseudomonadota bacterium]
MSQVPPTVPPVSGSVFMMLARDKPGSEGPRGTYLADHLRYVEANFGAYLACGPIHNESGDTVGSFFLVTAEDADGAAQLLAGDPYAQCGEVYESVECNPATVAAGTWMGGVIWDQSIFS